MNECTVCFEMTTIKTKCDHYLCDFCCSQLRKSECPYCRSYIKTWKHKDMNIPFYYFANWFDSIYKKNSIYHSLKIGIENPGILNYNIEYPFVNEFAECSWTQNYDKAIFIRVFDVQKDANAIRIQFCTPGIDSKKKIYIFPIEMLDYVGVGHFYWWIKQKIPELKL